MSEHITLEREQDLLGLVLGDLEEAKRAKIAAHVEACTEGCKEYLAKHADLPVKLDGWMKRKDPAPRLAIDKEKLLARLERTAAIEVAVREAEESAAAREQSAAKEAAGKPVAGKPTENVPGAGKEADVIPIERARWRRTRVLATSGWAAAAAAAAVAVALHGGAVPMVAQNPAGGGRPAAQAPGAGQGAETAPAMASAGMSAIDELPVAQSRAVFDIQQDYTLKALADYDEILRKVRKVGVPADKAEAVAREIVESIENTVKWQRLAPMRP